MSNFDEKIDALEDLITRGIVRPGVPSILYGDYKEGEEARGGSKMSAAEGVKLDQGKAPYHLIAPELLEAIAEILEFGAKKYAPRNWEKGMDWSRVFSAMQRHAWAWWRREPSDSDTGKSHLWHLACCVMFLVTYEMRSVGRDDRPATESK